MKTFKLIFLGLLTFTLTAIWLAPAAFVAPYIEQAAPNVRITNASGTIWNGQASSVNANNFDLGSVNWEVSPLKSLFSLSLVADLDIKGSELNASGNAAYGYDKSIRLNEVKFDADAGIVRRFQPQLQLAGKFEGIVDNAEIQPGGFPVINGVINLVKGSVIFPRVEPGNYRADIQSEDNSLIAEISSVDAALSLDGKASINSNWQYQSDVLAKANPGLNPMIMNLLKPVAGSNPGPDGSLRINRKGTITPIQLY